MSTISLHDVCALQHYILHLRTVKSFAGESKEIIRFAKALQVGTKGWIHLSTPFTKLLFTQGILDISSWKSLLQGGSMGFTVAWYSALKSIVCVANILLAYGVLRLWRFYIQRGFLLLGSLTQ